MIHLFMFLLVLIVFVNCLCFKAGFILQLLPTSQVVKDADKLSVSFHARFSITVLVY